MQELSDIHKWSLAESCNDSMGKSSLVIPIGAILVLVSIALAIVQACVYVKTKDVQLVPLTMFFLVSGTTLLGAHKIMEGKLQNIMASLPDNPVTTMLKTEISTDTQQ